MIFHSYVKLPEGIYYGIFTNTFTKQRGAGRLQGLPAGPPRSVLKRGAAGEVACFGEVDGWWVKTYIYIICGYNIYIIYCIYYICIYNYIYIYPCLIYIYIINMYTLYICIIYIYYTHSLTHSDDLQSYKSLGESFHGPCAGRWGLITSSVARAMVRKPCPASATDLWWPI